MKVYLVSFPDDAPILKRIREKEKREILLSYFFLRKAKPLREVLAEMGADVGRRHKRRRKNENK